jgi:hypothetical protein
MCGHLIFPFIFGKKSKKGIAKVKNVLYNEIAL